MNSSWRRKGETSGLELHLEVECSGKFFRTNKNFTILMQECTIIELHWYFFGGAFLRKNVVPTASCVGPDWLRVAAPEVVSGGD